MDFQDIRDRLVMAALPHAVFDGWTMKTLTQAAFDLELDISLAERAFMGGPAEAVAHFADLGDRLMLADCLDMDFPNMRTHEKVRALIKARLTRWAPHREALRRVPVGSGLAAERGVGRQGHRQHGGLHLARRRRFFGGFFLVYPSRHPGGGVHRHLDVLAGRSVRGLR